MPRLKLLFAPIARAILTKTRHIFINYGTYNHHAWCCTLLQNDAIETHKLVPGHLKKMKFITYYIEHMFSYFFTFLAMGEAN